MHPVESEYFEQSFLGSAVRKFKHEAEVYRLVATELQVAPSRLRLVAAHAWDVLGAMRAGCVAAFTACPGNPLYPLADKPDIVEPDLCNVADQILRRGTAESHRPSSWRREKTVRRASSRRAGLGPHAHRE